jgi:hypothetical protein
MFQGNHQLSGAGIQPAFVPHISETEQKAHLFYFYIFLAVGRGGQ